MAAKPHYYPLRDAWFIWEKNAPGTRVRRFLAKTQQEADRVWLEAVRAGRSVKQGDPPFPLVAGKWLERQYQRRERQEVSATWLARVVRTVGKFTSTYPTMTCSELTPAVARAWLPVGSSASYEHSELSTIKQVLKWAVGEGQYLQKSPLETLQLSRGKRREVIITEEQHRAIVEQAGRARFRWAKDARGKRLKWPKAAKNASSLRALLWFAWWTGARPAELRLLDWSHLNEDCTRAVLREHKTAGSTGRARVLYFNPLAQLILQNHRKTDGPVFTTSRGNRWSKDELVRQIGVVQERTGIEVTAYAYRHSFITRALIAGKDAATVAEFTGTSLAMISAHYSHLDKAKSHLASLASDLR